MALMRATAPSPLGNLESLLTIKSCRDEREALASLDALLAMAEANFNWRKFGNSRYGSVRLSLFLPSRVSLESDRVPVFGLQTENR